MTLAKIKLRLATFFIPGILFYLSPPIQADIPPTGSSTVFVSYANANSNVGLNDSPTVNISFNGSEHHVPFIMDTGSVGIIASEDIFQPAPGAQNLGPGRQIYSSSGIVEEGTWWSATQNIYDSNGTLLATSNVPVLQVTKISCQPHARGCQANDHPTGISVMGIGFARESNEQPLGTPPYNAFLNLQTVLRNGMLQPLPKDWINGYVVTPTGVYLGLTSSNTAKAGWVKLLPWPQYSTPSLPEWMPAPMTIVTNGVGGDGNILMDTGVDTGFLTPPPGANLGSLVQCPGTSLVECAPNGDTIKVYLPNQTNPVAYYNFTIGQPGNPMQPDGVHVESGSNIFFNTSRHILGGINFIYDNTNGYVGYIWNGMSGKDVGYVIPSSTLTSTSLSSSTPNAKFGKKVTFTAKVIGAIPSVIPTGTVTFIVDNKSQASVRLSRGRASFSTSTLPPLVHTITAQYSGDANYRSSSSPELIQHIKPPKCF